MSISSRRQEYKLANGEFEYPEFFEYFKVARRSLWSIDEVRENAIRADWETASDLDREVITKTFGAFTQLEVVIEDYWSTLVPRLFPKPEIASMCSMFSAQEAIHAEAYSWLSSIIGLNEHEALLKNETAKAKLEYFSPLDDILSLGIFSGAGEGVSLFSSFAILLSLRKEQGKKWRSLAQIISWSALDEQLHSNAGCQLFSTYAKEVGICESTKDRIVEGFDQVLRREADFIGEVLQGQRFNGVTQENLEQYRRLRANERLAKLSINHRYPVDREKANEISSWFDVLMNGNISHDFFATKDGSVYSSTVNKDFSKVDYSKFSTYEYGLPKLDD